MIGRALRSGHSLAAGINLVGDEMSQPIAGEFAFLLFSLGFIGMGAGTSRYWQQQQEAQEDGKTQVYCHGVTQEQK